MANAISSLKLGEGTYVFTTPYATCDTAAGTVDKVATITPGSNFSLETGARVAVKFSYANTASAPTLNVNSTGAKSIYFKNATIVSSLNFWSAGQIVEFIYDGTNWNYSAAVSNTNTTNSAGSSNTSSKIFLIGATSQTSSATTYSHDTAYVDTDGCVYSNSEKTATLGDNQTFTGMNSFTNNVSCQSGVMATNGSSLLDNASLKYNEITRYKDGTTYNLSIPEKSGTLATTSDIPSTSDFVTTGTAQTITGTKTFTSRAEFNSGITTSGTNDFKVQGLYDVSLPTKSGTVALTSDIPSTSNFASLSGVNEFTGSNTFTTNVIVKSSNSLVAQGSTALNHTDYSFGKIVHTPDATVGSYTLTLPSKTGTIATLDDIGGGSTSNPINRVDLSFGKCFMSTYFKSAPSFNAKSVWTDFRYIYYSSGSNQYVLDKSTMTWSAKTWSGLTSFYGSNIWTDGIYIYYSNSSTQYRLSIANDLWETKTWNGLTSFYGNSVWTDGENIYYSYGSTHYVLDRSTSTWSAKTWSGLTSFYGSNIWADGENIYYSSGSSQYVLNKSTSTWSAKTWSGITSLYASYIWTDDENIYYSSGSSQYVLNKSTSTWSAKTWVGLTSFSGDSIWTYNGNIYYTFSYILKDMYTSMRCKK